MVVGVDVEDDGRANERVEAFAYKQSTRHVWPISGSRALQSKTPNTHQTLLNGAGTVQLGTLHKGDAANNIV